MAKKDKNKQNAVPRQSWTPHWSLGLLGKLWGILVGAVKIALGALATVLLICVVCAFVFAGILAGYLEDDILPDAQIVKENYDMDETSYMHYVDANGNIQELQEIYASIDREWATYDEFPEALVHAAVAIEDKRFYEHQGVDWITTVKACAGMFFGSGDAGGSTITQQLVKNMTGDNSVTVRRKVVEIFKAQDFERRYDKDVIMEWYLNMIYFGDRKNGVKSAAAHYFGKELQSLTPAECASLISITNNPSVFSPYSSTFMYKGELLSGKERNRIRQVNTLWEMRNQGYLTEEEYRQALDQEMVFKSGIADEDRLATCEAKDCGYRCIVRELDIRDGKFYCPNCEAEVAVGDNASQAVYTWFVDTVFEDVAAVLAARDGMVWNDLDKQGKEMYRQLIQRGGYHIYTTLDMKVQDQVDKIYMDLDQIPETRGAQQLQSGIIVIDNRTGDIVAMAGGVDKKTVFDAFSMATDAKRQVGSSIKPLTVYAPAFESGEVTPATVIKDMPMWYENEKTPYPRNAERYYSYSMTVLDGVVDSVNAVAVNTLDRIGTDYSFAFGKEKFRLSGLLEAGPNNTTDISYSPLALGGLTRGATVRDMASAYATFANEGVWREGRTYTKVYDSEGVLVIDNTQDSEQILSQKTVDYMNYCLDQAVDHGTGTMTDIDGIDVCGKTGTTNSKNDRYFCGFTGYYTAAVWCGFEQPAEINLVGDTRHPAGVLWHKVMAPLHKGKDNIKLYNKDKKMVSVTVCLDSGDLATDACKADVRGGRTKKVMVYKEDVPEDHCEKHIEVEYCADGEAVANEWCKKFAEVGKVKLETSSLVQMTKEELAELKKASKVGLKKAYYADDYIYYVDEEGEPLEFTGIFGDLEDNTDPCVTCQEHTKESWEEYEAEHPWVDDPDADPDKDPDDPDADPDKDPDADPDKDPTEETKEDPTEETKDDPADEPTEETTEPEEGGLEQLISGLLGGFA